MAQFYSMSQKGWHQLSLTVRDTSMGTQREESEHGGGFYFLWNKPNQHMLFSVMKMSYPGQWLLMGNALLRYCFLKLLGNHDQIRGGSPSHLGEQRVHCLLCFQRAASVKRYGASLGLEDANQQAGTLFLLCWHRCIFLKIYKKLWIFQNTLFLALPNSILLMYVLSTLQPHRGRTAVEKLSFLWAFTYTRSTFYWVRKLLFTSECSPKEPVFRKKLKNWAWRC